VKNNYNMRRVQDTDKKGEVMRYLMGKEEKPHFTPQLINKIDRLDIDPWKS
tara:strand:+ start:1048 stop:1200 length:153 start_codon:yes stop_codon:yes gene_type:complete